MKENEIINYVEFLILNIEQLEKNYKKRVKFIKKTPFHEYCSFIHTAYKKGFWLPKEYTNNITINK